MEQLVRLQLVEHAKEDAAETLVNEQASHWLYNVDPDNPSHLPKPHRPEEGYFNDAFDSSLAFSDKDLSLKERDECWELYQQTYADAMARGVRAMNKMETPEGDWSIEDENEILEAGAEAAKSC